MKVLLLNPPYLKGFVRTARCTWLPISGSLWYPIFLAYCAGWLKIHDHKIKLVDAVAEDLSAQKTLDLAKEFKPELLVLYSSLTSIDNDVVIGTKIKKSTGCLLVIVGPWSSIYPEKTLKKYPAVDVIVKQEFDNPVLKVANGRRLKEIPGIIWKNDRKIVNNDGFDFVSSQDLDNFPFVSQIYKEFLPIKNYHQASLLYPFVDMFTARGCPWGKCTFCLWPQTIQKGIKYRQRSIENVVEELKSIERHLPEVKEVFFQDDMIPSNRAQELSEKISKNNLKIAWSGYAKANLPLKTLQMMRKSGCRFLHVGFESADQEILNNVKKGITLEQMEEFVRNAKSAKIQVHGDFIFGLPGETTETIKKTIKWAKKQKIEAYQFTVPEAHPTTEFYEWLKTNHFLTKDGKPSYPKISYPTLDEWRFRAMRELQLTPEFLFKLLIKSKDFSELSRLVRTGFYLLPHLLLKGRKTNSNG